MPMGGMIAPVRGARGACGLSGPPQVAMTGTPARTRPARTRVEGSRDFTTDGGDRLRRTAGSARGLAARTRVKKVVWVAEPVLDRRDEAGRVSGRVCAVPPGAGGALVASPLGAGAEVAVASGPACRRPIHRPDETARGRAAGGRSALWTP
jgi:hypothetical protein